jgi:hypothetical protein
MKGPYTKVSKRERQQWIEDIKAEYPKLASLDWLLEQMIAAYEARGPDFFKALEKDLKKGAYTKKDYTVADGLYPGLEIIPNADVNANERQADEALSVEL